MRERLITKMFLSYFLFKHLLLCFFLKYKDFFAEAATNRYCAVSDFPVAWPQFAVQFYQLVFPEIYIIRSPVH